MGSVMVSQPSRFSISGLSGPPHRRGSLRQMRWATPSAWAALTRWATAASTSAGMWASIVGGAPSTRASRCCSTPSMSWFIATTNCSMPASRRTRVTSAMSMPASASFCRSSAGSWSAVGPVISAFSAAASSVAIGIVLTVSGATRSSTYMVSG